MTLAQAREVLDGWTDGNVKEIGVADIGGVRDAIEKAEADGQVRDAERGRMTKALQEVAEGKFVPPPSDRDYLGDTADLFATEEHAVPLKGVAGIASDLVYLEQFAFGRSGRESKLLQRDGFRKALDTTSAGSGLEYIPSAFSEQFVYDVNTALKLPAAFQRYPMTSKQVTLPVEGDWPDVYLAAENADLTSTITESSPGTANVTLTAIKLAVRTIESFEWDDDALPVALNIIRSKLTKGTARGIEDALINGDSTATHMDTDIEALGATDHRTAFKGLRRKCIDDTGANVDCASFTADNLVLIKKAMGEYGADPANLVWVVGSSVLSQLLLLRDSQNNLLATTTDKYGPGASMLSGEVATLFGSPVIGSPFCREILNATGIHDGVTETKTALHCVWTPGWVIGERQSITLEAQRHVGAQATELVAAWRGDIQHALDTALTTGMGYNITS